MNLTDPGTLCLLLLAVVIALLVFRTRARLSSPRRQTEAEGAGSTGVSRHATLQPPEGGTTSSDSPVPDDVAQWEIQMHETARELAAQLDAKLSLLQALIAEAGRAAERLEELLERATAVLPPKSQADSLLPSGGGEPDAFNSAIASGIELDQMTSEAAPAENAHRSRRREEIYQLADYGFAPAEIARRVGAPVGEVELILSLRQR